jgi:hypothetical protein
MPEQSQTASRSSVGTLAPPWPTPGGTGTVDRADPETADCAPEHGPETPVRPQCPYLAGRPPHGSHHQWPSGLNVCYGRPREQKPYGQVSKETQAARCFSGTQPFDCCPDYERAQAGGIALPMFDGRPVPRPSQGESGSPGNPVQRKRVKRRHHRSPLRTWMKENGRTTLICAGWVALALAVFALLLRSMS